jgi:hypothetical protein
MTLRGADRKHQPSKSPNHALGSHFARQEPRTVATLEKKAARHNYMQSSAATAPTSRVLGYGKRQQKAAKELSTGGSRSRATGKSSEKVPPLSARSGLKKIFSPTAAGAPPQQNTRIKFHKPALDALRAGRGLGSPDAPLSDIGSHSPVAVGRSTAYGSKSGQAGRSNLPQKPTQRVGHFLADNNSYNQLSPPPQPFGREH